MLEPFVCPQGHRWNLNIDGELPAVVGCIVCPVCGAPAQILARKLYPTARGAPTAAEPVMALPVRPGTPAVRRARRRWAIGGLLAALAVVSVGGLGLLFWQPWQADPARTEDAHPERALAQVNALLRAPAQKVPALLRALQPVWQDALPELRRLWRQKHLPLLQRIRVGLALLREEPALNKQLAEWMLQVDEPEEVLLLRGQLRSHRAELTRALWKKVHPSAAGFRALVALADYDPDNRRWEQAAHRVPEPLLSAQAAERKLWVKALDSVRAWLLQPLARVFRGEQLPGKRLVAAQVLADYARDRPATLVDLLLDADPRQYAVLLPRLKEQRARCVALLKKELARTAVPAWKDRPLNRAWPTPPADLVEKVAAAQGMVAERFAFCQALPLDQFLAVVRQLGRCSYRPVRFRPYTARDVVQVAAVWTRDRRNWQLAGGAAADEIRRLDTDWRARGYLPLDVAGYRAKTDQGEPAELYAAVWVKGAARGEDARLYVDVPEAEHQVYGWGPLQQEGFVPWTCQALLGEDGRQRYSGVWRKTAPNPSFEYTFRACTPQYQGLARANPFQVDVCLREFKPPAGSREDAVERLAQAEKDLKARPNSLGARYRRAKAYLFLAQDRKALADLNAFLARQPGQAWGYYYRALVHARLGSAAQAKKDLAQFRRRSTLTGSGACLDALVAVHLGQASEGLKRLEQALARDPHNPAYLYEAACVYAVALRRLPGNDAARAREYAGRALKQLKEAVKQGYANFLHMQTDGDLDPLRQRPDFIALLGKVQLDRQYAAVWHGSPTLVSRNLNGQDPVRHLRRCRALASQGWRPAALTGAALDRGKTVVLASVWHRPIVPEADLDRLAGRQARAATALLHLGAATRVWPLLRQRRDPRLRTYLVHQLAPLRADARVLVQRLDREEDASVRRALILALGEFAGGALPAEVQRPLATRLLQAYRTDADPGLHAAADWLLRRWGHGAELTKIDQDLAGQPAGKRCWYVNHQGQTLVVVPGPVTFLMGSPESEPDRLPREKLHRRRIGRSFAIATREVTVRQFRRFLQANPDLSHSYPVKMSPDPDGPIIAVSWYEAAQYCRWLSEQERVPAEQMCYPRLTDIKPGMKLPADYLWRTGYRLPTEAEWEYACRAGRPTSRSYGSDPEMLEKYAWWRGPAASRARTGGLLKPNDLGLFDMLGNAGEWCQDRYAEDPRRTRGVVVEDDEDRADVKDAQTRVLRGGSFDSAAGQVRSAARRDSRPSLRDPLVGLRVARTQR